MQLAFLGLGLAAVSAWCWMVYEFRQYRLKRPNPAMMADMIVDGVPQIHIEVDFDQLISTAPLDVLGNDVKIKKWTQGVLDEIQRRYEALKPGEVFVHGEAIKVSSVLGPTAKQLKEMSLLPRPHVVVEAEAK